jgi:hypothetical protein
MFKEIFSVKNGKSYLGLDEIKNSIESAEESILKEQEEFKKNAERTRAEIERGVRPSGKKFRL